MLSVVVATRDRAALLARCLSALAAFDGDFEVVVADQGKVAAKLPADPRFRRVADPGNGLSSARNAGLRASRGEVVAFLDDDAVPAGGYVEGIEATFRAHPAAGALAGRILRLEDGRPYARVHGPAFRELGRSGWLLFMGGNFVLRRPVAEATGPFDERFGAGCRWGSGEESDYFFRLLRRGVRVLYSPAVTVLHPREEVEAPTPALREKLRGYGRGQGALFARHWSDFSSPRALLSFAASLAKPLLRTAQYNVTRRPDRARLHAAVARGRWEGFLEYLRDGRRGGGPPC